MVAVPAIVLNEPTSWLRRTWRAKQRGPQLARKKSLKFCKLGAHDEATARELSTDTAKLDVQGQKLPDIEL